MKKHIVQLKNWILILVALLSFGGLSKDVKAASGNVYSCQIARTYQHPVTGKVEDSGGSSSKATGQGMVEGAISSKGLLEVTDAGDYYLTFRISLVDYTSNLGFSVQKRGESRFQTQSVTQTATGKDNNGTTKDLRIKLSSQDSIIRCSMYVVAMGRQVVFYITVSNLQAGSGDFVTSITVDPQQQATTPAGNTPAAEQTPAAATPEATPAAETEAPDPDTGSGGLEEFDASGNKVGAEAETHAAGSAVWWIIGGLAVAAAGFSVWFFGFFRRKKQ